MVRSPRRAVREYIARINARDAEGLEGLAGPNLRFVDALGTESSLGCEGWEAYFATFPDYRIRVDRILFDGPFVAVFGFAQGSYRGKGDSVPGASWRIPTAWRAKVRHGKIIEWRVYCDVEPMLRSAGRGRFR